MRFRNDLQSKWDDQKLSNDGDKLSDSAEGSGWSSIRSIDSIPIAEGDEINLIEGSERTKSSGQRTEKKHTFVFKEQNGESVEGRLKPQIVLNIVVESVPDSTTEEETTPNAVQVSSKSAQDEFVFGGCEPRRRISFLLPETAENPFGISLKNRRMSTPAMPSSAAQQQNKPSRPKIPTLKILSENLNALDLRSSVPLSPTSLCKPKDSFTLRLNPDVEEILSKLCITA